MSFKWYIFLLIMQLKLYICTPFAFVRKIYGKLAIFSPKWTVLIWIKLYSQVKYSSDGQCFPLHKSTQEESAVLHKLHRALSHINNRTLTHTHTRTSARTYKDMQLKWRQAASLTMPLAIPLRTSFQQPFWILCLFPFFNAEEVGPTIHVGRSARSPGSKEDVQPGNLSGLVGTSASVCLQRDPAGEWTSS